MRYLQGRKINIQPFMGYYLKNSTVIAETKQENMAFAREKKE
jgi:hypothetical protein